MIAYNLFNP